MQVVFRADLNVQLLFITGIFPNKIPNSTYFTHISNSKYYIVIFSLFTFLIMQHSHSHSCRRRQGTVNQSELGWEEGFKCWLDHVNHVTCQGEAAMYGKSSACTLPGK